MNDDALAREIEDALAVEPSPHFVARVLANKPARATWRFSRTVAVAGAAAAVVAVVLVMPGRRAPAPQPVEAVKPLVSAPAPVSPVAPREEQRVAAAAPSTTPIVPVVRRTRPAELEALFAKDELAALQRLTRGITRGTVDPATLSAPSTTTIAAIRSVEIVVTPLAEILPVTIESFGSLVEGVRQ